MEEQAVAQQIWSTSSPLTGTSAETYLRSLGIDATRLEELHDLRYHPECPLTGRLETAPALVTKLRDVQTGQPTPAIYATYLGPQSWRKGYARYGNGAFIVGDIASELTLYEATRPEDILVLTERTGGAGIAVLADERLGQLPLPLQARRVICGHRRTTHAPDLLKAAAHAAAARYEVPVWAANVPVGFKDWSDLSRSQSNDVFTSLREAIRFDCSSRTLEFGDHVSISPAVVALVKGIIGPGDFSVLYGASGAGKTFLALDLAHCVARGAPWHGLRVRSAPVLYVSNEGIRGCRHRIVALNEKYGPTQLRLARLQTHVTLAQGEGGDAGLDTILQALTKFEAMTGQPTGLVIIDTLARAIGGDDENSAQAMMGFVERRVGEIIRKTGAAVLVVHHPGKDSGRGMRGSTALFAASDTVLRIEQRSKSRDRTLIVEKSKDGEEGPLLKFQLTRVTLDTDDDGDPITSCTIDFLPMTLASGTEPAEAAGSSVEAVMVVYERLSAKSCGPIDEKLLIEECLSAGIGSSNAATPQERLKARRRTVVRNITAAVSKGFLQRHMIDGAVTYSQGAR